MIEFATKDGVIKSFGNIKVKSMDSGVAHLEQHLWMFNKGEESAELRESTIDVRSGDTKNSIEDRLNSGRNYFINDQSVVRDLTAIN